MRGVLWHRHLWNVVYGQHRLHKLGHVHGCQWIATQQPDISWSVRRTASRRRLSDPKQCTAVTAHGTFRTQSANFLTRPHVPKLHNGTLVFTGANYYINWHWPVSCAAAAEVNTIMQAVDEYHNRTSIRLVRQNSQPTGDYVHITGENSGCWSSIGRIGRVSNTVQGVVKKSPALRISLLGFNCFTPQNKSRPVYLMLYSPPPGPNLVNNSRTVLSELQ